MNGARTPVLAARNVGKTFAGRTVLRDVDLEVLPGEVHGLVGQNGSGKSTLIKILAGFHAPDPGAALAVHGQPVALPLGPGDPARLGLAFVHQDLGLLESGTVLENLRVGRFRTGLGWRISWRREREAALAALRRFGVDVDPGATVSALGDVERALLAIVRALDQVGHHEAGVLVLDEPTAYLPRDSADALFAAVRRVAAAGFGVIFVSHRLAEVRALCDRVTVLRDGRVVATAETASLGERDLIARILGFSLEDLYPEVPPADPEVLVSVRGLASPGVRDFSLDVRRGEVVGLAGLLGMGHEEVPYLLFGAARADAGTMTIGGRAHDIAGLTPRRAMGLGLALLPGNRLRDGGLPTATGTENLTLATIGRHVAHGVLRLRRERAATADLMRRFDVRPPEPARRFATFSGGNQQKILVAKWFATRPRLMLLHEPAQGVDVGAKRQIFAHVRDAAAAGTAFLVASVEYEDLAHLCDRVFVFRHGRAVAELRGADLTQERIAEQSLRAESEPLGAP